MTDEREDDPGGEKLLARVRAICLALPDATEGAGVGNPSWRVRDKIFAMRHDAHSGRWGIWCKARPGAQATLIETDPTRFFRPPYVGVHGWVGISLEVPEDWDLVATLMEEAYRMTAPKRLVAQLDGNSEPAAPRGVRPPLHRRAAGLHDRRAPLDPR